MKKLSLSLTVLLLSFCSVLNAAEPAPVHTEDNEITCQFADFLETRLFVDKDNTLDSILGALNTKVLEMPTKNAHGYNYKVFRTKLVKVLPPSCETCGYSQTILYTSEGIDDIINRLEITDTKAVLIRNVDVNGNPLQQSLTEEAACSQNEPE